MSQNQSPAVIDATNAEVLAPEVAPPVLTERQTEELEKCSFHLQRLSRTILTREIALVYHYVEAGWWLLRACAIHRVATCQHGEGDGKFCKQGDRGFIRWLESKNGW